MKKRVVLGQLGWGYDNEVWLPTAAGAIAAHCLASDEFKAAYDIDPDFPYERIEPADFIRERMEQRPGQGAPDVVALSHYVWNQEINFAVLRAVKQAWPNCLTVLGGPSVGEAGPAAEKLLREHPEVDVLVHGEGEETFRALVLADAVGYLNWSIDGISYLSIDANYCKGAPRPRRKNLDDFPSPFLTGVFDHVLALGAAKGQRFSAVWEPDRGCPFDCSFCAWGSATASKVNTFGMDRLMGELAWFATHQIGFVYGASANFGLLYDRDYALAQFMSDMKQQFGYPQRFMVNTSKNATDRIFKLSKLLHDAGLSKGATLSMQSWDEQTLVAIGRNNIKLSTYEKLQTMFRDAGVPTYAELILGLPGETLDSFCDGVDKNLDAGQHDGLFVYLCRVLPGTEMADEAYRAKHGIETVRLPIQANHGSLDAATIGPTEYEETVIATATMPHADWLECQRIAWFVEVFFVLGIARLPLLWLRERGVKVTEFARWAWRAMATGNAAGQHYPRLCAEWFRVVGYLVSQDAGTPEVPRDGLAAFGEIRWPIEEASWLALMSQKAELFRVNHATGSAYGELFDLFSAFIAQRWSSNTRRLRQGSVVTDFPFSWDAILPAVQENARRIKHWTDGTSPADPATFAREIVWFGRRGGSMLHAETS